MNKVSYEIVINAPVEKVYKIMIGGETFPEWTKVFNPNSHFVGNWEVGTTMYFIGTNENGEKEGMVSRIIENNPHHFISILHQGILKDDIEITSGPEVEGWTNVLENYHYKKLSENQTKVKVEMDMHNEFVDYFDVKYPEALEKLKKICEE